MGDENKPDIKRIHYRDMVGNLLWSEPMTFSRLYGRGDVIQEGGKAYTVRRVAVAGKIQHVNLEPGAHDHLGSEIFPRSG